MLRFGANDETVIARLRWLADSAGPLLGAAIRASGGIDLRAVMSQALRMGDEMHQRNVAASALLGRILTPHVARAASRTEDVARIAELMGGNDQFFLNLAMAAGKAGADPCLGIAGIDDGGDDGAQRHRVRHPRRRPRRPVVHAPVERPDRARTFPALRPGTRTPTSATAPSWRPSGSAASPWRPRRPSSASWARGGLADAIRITEEMAEISLGEHPHFRIPTLDERGTPVGIDVRRVVETGITPLINTGIAGRIPGTGQIGAGIVRAPLACFEAALAALALEAVPRTG